MNVSFLRTCANLAAVLILSIVAAGFAGRFIAQTNPSGPLRIIAPYAAGGLTDAVARTIGGKVADAIGQPVIVDNRPGGREIATSTEAKAIIGINSRSNFAASKQASASTMPLE